MYIMCQKFLSVKEIFSIGERTFGTSLKKKSWWRLDFSIRESYRRKNFFLSAKELWAILRKKKSWRRLNFSIRDSYRRKNFGPSSEKKKLAAAELFYSR